MRPLLHHRFYNAFRRAAQVALMGMAALAACGCSMSLPFVTPSAREKASLDAPESTGAIAPAQPNWKDDVAPPLAEEDWLHARMAMAEALNDSSPSASVPWENAASRRHGTIAALARAEGKDQNCRAFLGSAVAAKDETWFEGKACKELNGAWRLTEVRRWKKDGR